MSVLLTPLVEFKAVELSKKDGLFRKQILPKGKFNYKGEVIDFDEIGKDAKAAFDAGALDQVAFQLADSGNNHNFDPKNYRGEVKNVELTDEGTFATIDFSHYPDMQELVTKNPKFGVSARIERNLKRGDGKTFTHAFSHILGTLNPRVTGMKPWEAVTLSNVEENEEVFDLSNVEDLGEVMETKTEEGIQLSKDDYEALMKLVNDQKLVEEAFELANKEDEEESPAIKLANERAESALKLARESQVKLAATEWSAKSAEYVRAGVPPKMLELAKPLMERPDADVNSIELSNGDKVDPKAVLLSVLEEAKGTIDLSEGKGHEFDGSETNEEDDPNWQAFRDNFFQNQF